MLKKELKNLFLINFNFIINFIIKPFINKLNSHFLKAANRSVL